MSKLLKSHVILTLFNIITPVIAFAQFQQSNTISANIGYSSYEGMYSSDSNFALLRLAFGREFFIKKSTALGLQLGVQTSSTMRLNIPNEIIEPVGGVPIKVSIKPTADLLFTLKTPIIRSVLFMAKAGGAYRAWQFDGCAVNNMNKISPEFQLGLNYDVDGKYTFDLMYQRIQGKKLAYFLDAQTEKLSISGITSQNTLLFGITLMLDRIKRNETDILN